MVTRDREPGWEQEPAQQWTAVLDAGGQYAIDIEKLLKKSGFFARRLPFDTPLEELRGASAVIMSGGPESVYAVGAPMCDPRLLEPDEERPPVLGICYGAQLINHIYGGRVGPDEEREDGFTDVVVEPSSSIFQHLAPDQVVMMSHGDSILEVAPGFETTARSSRFVAAIANPDKQLYGVQFHPERSTVEGPAMLRNFLQNIAGMEGDFQYSYEEIIEDSIAEIQELVGDRQVLAFISGGVDSACLAKLLERALPSEQLFLAHIDNGLMREKESRKVVEDLAEAGINVHFVDASEMFLNGTTTIDGQGTPPLHEVIDPEVKRAIIGDVFIKVRDMIAGQMELDQDNFVLAMGTLFADLVESGSKIASAKAATIKTHHNDTEAVKRLRDEDRVIEPWRYLQKDEVREVGRLLGLPEKITQRHPFPGPGLAIRIICAEEPSIIGNSEEVTAQLSEFNGRYISTSLLGIKTVGIQGDERTYGNLTALSGEADWQQLLTLAREIPRAVKSVNRVVYIFGEQLDEQYIDSITPTRVNLQTLEELRYVDSRVNELLRKYGLDRKIAQVPVVLFPINFGKAGKRSVGIRTMVTDNFKTGDIALPGRDFPDEIIWEVVDRVQRIPGIARVAYDLTSKPPGTTEWE